MKINVGVLFPVFVFFAVVLVLAGSVVAPRFLGQPIIPAGTFVENVSVTVQVASQTKLADTAVPTSTLTSTVTPTRTSSPSPTATVTPSATSTATPVPSATFTASPSLTPTVTMPPEDSYYRVYTLQEAGRGTPNKIKWDGESWVIEDTRYEIGPILITKISESAEGEIVFKFGEITFNTRRGTFFRFTFDTGKGPKRGLLLSYDPSSNTVLGTCPESSCTTPLSQISFFVEEGKPKNQPSWYIQHGCEELLKFPDNLRRWAINGYPIHDPKEEGCPFYSISQ